MMNGGKTALGLAVALALAIPLAGCAGKVRLSSAKLCQAHGGTYNAATQSCTYTQSTRSARQSCQESGGYYDDAAQICEVGME